MESRVLDYFALVVLIFVVITIIYGVIFIHDIPYEIAKKRKHPHQDAIHTAGWVSLFLMHTIWPFLWIWATLYKPGVGWGMAQTSNDTPDDSIIIKELESRIDQLEEANKAASQEATLADELSKRVAILEDKLQGQEEV